MPGEPVTGPKGGKHKRRQKSNTENSTSKIDAESLSKKANRHASGNATTSSAASNIAVMDDAGTAFRTSAVSVPSASGDGSATADQLNKAESSPLHGKVAASSPLSSSPQKAAAVSNQQKLEPVNYLMPPPMHSSNQITENDNDDKSGGGFDTSNLLSSGGSRSHSRCGRQRRSLSKRKQQELAQQTPPESKEESAPFNITPQIENAPLAANNSDDASFPSLVSHAPHPQNKNPAAGGNNNKRRNSRINSMQTGFGTGTQHSGKRDASDSDNYDDVNPGNVIIETTITTAEVHADDTAKLNANYTPPAHKTFSAPLKQKQQTDSVLPATLQVQQSPVVPLVSILGDETSTTDDDEQFSAIGSGSEQHFYSPLSGSTEQGLNDDDDDDNNNSDDTATENPDSSVNRSFSDDIYSGWQSNNHYTSADESKKSPAPPKTIASDFSTPPQRKLSDFGSNLSQKTTASQTLVSSSPRNNNNNNFQSEESDDQNDGDDEDASSVRRMSTYESLATNQLRPVPGYPDPQIYQQETFALQPPSASPSARQGDDIYLVSQLSVDLTELGSGSVIEIGGDAFNSKAFEQYGILPREATSSPSAREDRDYHTGYMPLHEESGDFLDFLSSPIKSNESASEMSGHSDHVHFDESYADAIKQDANVPEARVDYVSANATDRNVPTWGGAAKASPSAPPVHLDSQKSFPAMGATAYPIDELDDVIDGATREGLVGVDELIGEIKTPLDAGHAMERLQADGELNALVEQIERSQNKNDPEGRGNLADDEEDEDDDEMGSDDENSFHSRLAASARVSGPGATPWVGAAARPRPSFDTATAFNTEANKTATNVSSSAGTKSVSASASSTTVGRSGAGSTPQSILVTKSSKSDTVNSTLAAGTPTSKSGVGSGAGMSGVERQSQKGGASGDAGNKQTPLSTVTKTTKTTTASSTAAPPSKTGSSNTNSVLWAGADTHGGATRNVSEKMTKVTLVETAKSEPTKRQVKTTTSTVTASSSSADADSNKNLMIYVGIGVAVLAVGGLVCWRMMATKN